MKLLGLKIINYNDYITDKWVPFGKMYAEPNQYDFVATTYELPQEITSIYSNTSDINVSGVISNDRSAYSVLYQIFQNFRHDAYQQPNVRANLYYVIGADQFMITARGERLLHVYRVYPDKEPLDLGVWDECQDLYPYIFCSDESYFKLSVDDTFRNIIYVSFRKEIYGSTLSTQSFIKNLTNEFDGKYKHVHILCLTDSLFVLTDLLADNCTCVDDDLNVRDFKCETFGGNLYTIMDSCLKLKASMGDIATDFISKQIIKANNGEDVNPEIVKYIGDEMIKNYILNKNKK